MAAPIKKFGRGGVSVAVWQNDRGLSASVQMRYKPKGSEEWKDTKYAYARDLKELGTAALEAAKFMEDNDPRKPTQDVAVIDGGSYKMPEPKVLDNDDIPF